MNNYQKHDVLINQYTYSAKLVQKLRMYAFIFQTGIWGMLFFLKSMHVQYVNWIATILFGIFLLTRLRDFSFRRNLDIQMSQMTSEGLKLEQSNPRLENYFHQVLEQFGIIRVLLLRSMFDIFALYLFANSAYQLYISYHPDFSWNMTIIYSLVGALGFFLSDLYYAPLKSMLFLKQEAFSS